jgi:hypothetical protein
MGALLPSINLRIALRRFLIPALLLAAGSVCLGSAPRDEGERPVRIRIEWTADKPEVWAGVLETSNGTLTRAASLSTAADQAGTLWADGTSLWLGRHAACRDDGFDVTVFASTSARLSFTLQNAEAGGWRQQFEWNLADLGVKPGVFAFADRKGELSISRAPGDSLRISVDRPHLIYRPGEVFKAVVLPDMLCVTTSATSKKPAAAALDWEVGAAHGSKTLRQGSLPLTTVLDGASDKGIPVEITLPSDEGSYDLRFRVGGNGPIAQESLVQVLVLGDRLPGNAKPTACDMLVDHFRAGEHNVQRLIERGPKTRPVRSHAAQSADSSCAVCTLDDAGACGADVNWSAYRLELKHPQQPHRLIVELVAKGNPAAGLSLLEPNGASRATPFAVESGFANGPSLELSTDSPSPAERTRIRKQILFWPRVREPVLLLHDMGQRGHVELAGVEVYELGSPATDVASYSSSPAARDERLVGPYISKPNFIASLGAPQGLDRLTQRGFEDWDTFHVVALRLADYLHGNGDNSLMLGVLAEGSTIYPSAFLEPTPRFDAGTLASSGQDPMRKDVVELLYRVFDREGLVLIPELQFSSPLPGLERQLAAGGPAVDGIELAGPDGRSWREAVGVARASAPYYNPLDSRVQNAVLEVVREFVERYHRHPSFRGIALEVDRSGYLQFPGLEWGCDDATLARFQNETGVQIDGDAGSGERTENPKERGQRRHELLTGEARARWIAWRCAELAKFHRRLAEVVTASSPNARLVLSCKQVLCSNSEAEIRSEIRMRGRFGDLLPQRGLDFSLLQNVPRLVVLRPAIWHASTNPEDRLLDDAVNDNASFAAAFCGSESGVLAVHRPQECRVRGVAAASPGHSNSVRLAVHACPSGFESRRRFVRALASSDAQMMFDGGWRFPLGQDEEARDLRKTVRALPRIPFYKVEGDEQPVVVRVARRDKKTYIYAANEFAEPIQLAIQLTCPPGTACRPLGRSRPAVIEAADGSPGRIVTPLEGYGLAAWEIDHEDVRVENFRTEMPQPAIASLKGQIQKFSRLADVRRANQPKREGTSRPSESAEAVDLTAASDKPDSSRVEPRHERPVAGAAYWSFDRNGARVDEADEARVDIEPLSTDDLRQLAKISLEISLAWEEQRFAECQRLLDSYWGRYLLLESERPAKKASLREALVPPKQLSR